MVRGRRAGLDGVRPGAGSGHDQDRLRLHPPDQRGHGYAAGVTAGISRWAQQAGIKHVTLFTDDANPVSNRIYQRLGFEYVLSYLEVKFTGEPLRH
ncbi:GNAT family N-acetyltransferase [Amycolatopsis magusensis]|uniref:GNAT family N-acetyltransferase n=1 Tax=Amycolatopsis magusensis TaxID=882444 RepID=UPI0037B3CBCF